MNIKIIMLFGVICCLVFMIWILNRSIPMIQNTTSNAVVTSIDSPQPPPPQIAMNDSPSNNQLFLQEKELVWIAYERAKKGAAIPNTIEPKITYKGEIAEIIWPIEWPKGTVFPRGDYHALVEIDRRSGKILKVLVSP